MSTMGQFILDASDVREKRVTGRPDAFNRGESFTNVDLRSM